MCLPLLPLLRSYFCSCSFLLLYGFSFPSSSAFSPLFPCPDVRLPPRFFSRFSERSPTSCILCSILIFYFWPSTFLHLFSISHSSGVTLASPFRRFCSFHHILVPYYRTSTEHPIAWTAFSPLFHFPQLSGRLSFLFCTSFPPFIESDVFPYRRHFSFFRYYSGVISSSFLFPRAATWMARWLSQRTSHRLHHLLYSYALTSSQYCSCTVSSLKMGPTGCAETLANTNQHRQRNNAQERRRRPILFTS